MLPRKNRLKKKNDFEMVFKQGRAFGRDFLVLKTAKNKLDVCRIGLVVSKKVSRKAVARNQVKRRLREAARARLQAIKPGWDIVFLTRPGIAGKTFAGIEEEVSRLLDKAGLLNKDD